MDTPAAVFYPGDGCRRVRWETGTARGASDADLAAVRGFAAPELAPAVKAAKNLLKNALSAPMDFRLVAYRRIARGPGGELALQDSKGDTILLDDAPWMEATTHRLPMLPDGALLQDQVLLGGFWYDGAARRLKLQPLSIVAAGGIVRLLY